MENSACFLQIIFESFPKGSLPIYDFNHTGKNHFLFFKCWGLFDNLRNFSVGCDCRYKGNFGVQTIFVLYMDCSISVSICVYWTLDNEFYLVHQRLTLRGPVVDKVLDCCKITPKLTFYFKC